VREIEKFEDLGTDGTIILKLYLKKARWEPVDWIHLTGSVKYMLPNFYSDFSLFTIQIKVHIATMLALFMVRD